VLNIRLYQPRDLDLVRELHERHHAKDFDLPILDNPSMVGKWIIEDKDGPILFGGVNLLAEAIAVTDLDRSVEDRRKALYTSLEISLNCTNRYGLPSLHCTVFDDKWKRHLKKAGFRDCKGSFLYYDLGR
jgi:hypothetical protein